jgi:hypothetical protein
MMNEHTAKAFDADLQELARSVAEMGGLAEKQVADAVTSLAKRDGKRAQAVMAADPLRRRAGPGRLGRAARLDRRPRPLRLRRLPPAPGNADRAEATLHRLLPAARSPV